MAQFIRLTSPTRLVPLRVNVDLVLSYYPDELPEEPGTVGTAIFGLRDKPIHVRETAEEVDRLINPTGTR